MARISKGKFRYLRKLYWNRPFIFTILDLEEQLLLPMAKRGYYEGLPRIRNTDLDLEMYYTHHAGGNMQYMSITRLKPRNGEVVYDYECDMHCPEGPKMLAVMKEHMEGQEPAITRAATEAIFGKGVFPDKIFAKGSFDSIKHNENLDAFEAAGKMMHANMDNVHGDEVVLVDGIWQRRRAVS